MNLRRYAITKSLCKHHLVGQADGVCAYSDGNERSSKNLTAIAGTKQFPNVLVLPSLAGTKLLVLAGLLTSEPHSSGLLVAFNDNGRESDEALSLGYSGGDRPGFAPGSLLSTLQEEVADHQHTHWRPIMAKSKTLVKCLTTDS